MKLSPWTLVLLAAFVASASASASATASLRQHNCPVKFGHEHLHDKWIKICDDNDVERPLCHSWFHSACLCFQGNKRQCDSFASATLQWDVENNPHFQDVDDRVFVLWSGVSQSVLEHVWAKDNKTLPITLATAQRLLESVDPMSAYYNPPKKERDENTKIVWNALSEKFVKLAFHFSYGPTKILMLFGQYNDSSIFAQTEAIVLKHKNHLVDVEIRILKDFNLKRSQIPRDVADLFGGPESAWLHPCEPISAHVRHIIKLDELNLSCFSECNSLFENCVADRQGNWKEHELLRRDKQKKGGRK